MKKYRARQGCFANIEEVEIERETEKMVVLKSGIKMNKISAWYSYFDTFEEAKQYLIDKKKKEIDAAKLKLERLIIDFKKIEKIK